MANENRTQDAGHALLRQTRNPKVRKKSGVIGELGTYSDQTFERYEAMIGERAAASPQRNITEETLLHTVQLGGFDTLEEAEASQA